VIFLTVFKLRGVIVAVLCFDGTSQISRYTNTVPGAPTPYLAS